MHGRVGVDVCYFNDWFSHDFLQHSDFHEVPPISAYGLQYSAEAIWVGEPSKVNGKFTFDVKTTVRNQDVFFLVDELALSMAGHHFYEHPLATGGETFDTSWLKVL